jgi:hypothetical protein
MKANRSLALTCILFTVVALCGDFLMLLVGNALRKGMHQSMTTLAVGGLLGCLSLPVAYGFGLPSWRA